MKCPKHSTVLRPVWSTWYCPDCDAEAIQLVVTSPAGWFTIAPPYEYYQIGESLAFHYITNRFKSAKRVLQHPECVADTVILRVEPYEGVPITKNLGTSEHDRKNLIAGLDYHCEIVIVLEDLGR